MRIGKYVLRYLLGRGGMAEVWAADELGPDGYQNPVAIKLTLDALAADADALTLFLQEAKTATSLRHGNLVSTFSFDRTPADSDPALRGRYFLVMERVEGADLGRLTAALTGLGYSCPQKIAVFVIGEVLKGLAYVHARKDTNSLDMGLVHRDISPQNILVTYSGEVKISDFGIAKSMRAKHTGSIRGKLAYFAPEILNGRPASPASDQFAVGIVLWELLAGRPLFDALDDAQVLSSVYRCEIPPLGREIDPAFEAVMLKMLQKDVEHRFPSTEAALEAVFALPGYRPNGAPLGKLLASLLPDRDKRWTPASDARSLIEQLSGPVRQAEALEYPEPMAPSLGMAIDLSNNEAVPLSAGFVGQPPFDGLTMEGWAAWWRRRGVNRDAEVYVGAHPATKLLLR
jgi:serine/threonine-protein kinase